MTEVVEVIIYWDGCLDARAALELGELFYEMAFHGKSIEVAGFGGIQMVFKVELRDEPTRPWHKHKELLIKNLESLQRSFERLQLIYIAKP